MRSTQKKAAHGLGRAVNYTFAAGIALALLVSQTSFVAFQDMSELLGKKAENRWLMHIEQPQGQSIASLSGFGSSNSKPDMTITGSISSQLQVSEKPKSKANPQRINRSIKGNRVVQTTARKAPKDFSAGSILERHSLLEPLNHSKKLKLAFVKPKPVKEALQVASAFHVTKPKESYAPENLPVMVAKLVEQSKSSILAYSPEPEEKLSPFAAVLKEEQPIIIKPKLNKGDHAWAADPLPKNSFSKKQQACLAKGIYFEARGEPVKGQAAVSQVILNRVRNPHYPNTICGVVYQNQHWRNRCQFSFACDRIKDRITNKKLYELAQYVAEETSAGRIWLKQVGSSTHYHATYVRPPWRKRMKRVGRIGLHIFYRTYGGGWS